MYVGVSNRGETCVREAGAVYADSGAGHVAVLQGDYLAPDSSTHHDHQLEEKRVRYDTDCFNLFFYSTPHHAAQLQGSHASGVSLLVHRVARLLHPSDTDDDHDDLSSDHEVLS